MLSAFGLSRARADSHSFTKVKSSGKSWSISPQPSLMLTVGAGTPRSQPHRWDGGGVPEARVGDAAVPADELRAVVTAMADMGEAATAEAVADALEVAVPVTRMALEQLRGEAA